MLQSVILFEIQLFLAAVLVWKLANIMRIWGESVDKATVRALCKMGVTGRVHPSGHYRISSTVFFKRKTR